MDGNTATTTSDASTEERATKGEVAAATVTRNKETDSCDEWWSDLLLQAPKVTNANNHRRVVQFVFDNDSSTGGFHRLLLHAAVQYHGLVAVSKTASLQVDGNDEVSSEQVCRLLLVMGGRRPSAEDETDVPPTEYPRLLEHITALNSCNSSSGPNHNTIVTSSGTSRSHSPEKPKKHALATTTAATVQG